MFQSVILALALQTAAPAPPTGGSDEAQKGLLVVADCQSGSNVKLRIMDEKVKFRTEYGTLDIVTAHIVRIEFASRTPSELIAKIDGEIKNLNNPDFKAREAATANLKKIGPRAAPLLTKASKSDDPETARRANEVLQHLKLKHTEQELAVREFDVVQTERSKFEGRFEAEYFVIESEDFDKSKELYLHRLVGIRTGPAKHELQVNAPEAPGNMSAHQQQFGKEFTFVVTGFQPVPGAHPSVWGSGPYTLDSNLAAAAVHAGIVKPGERAVIRLRVVQSPAAFVGNFQNNITSSQYGNYPAGAYEFIR